VNIKEGFLQPAARAPPGREKDGDMERKRGTEEESYRKISHVT